MAEDTQNKQIEQGNEALIAEMLRDAEAKKAELPSELTKNPVVHKGDATLEAPMVLKEITSAGYVYVWDTRTFEKFPVLYYMLAQKLRSRRPDGSFRFTTNDPKQEPVHGVIKCMLHPDGENRSHYDGLGFRTCKKSNITNHYQLTQHMKRKHPQEWAAIEEERKEKERQEDRTLQKLLLASQANKLEERPGEIEQMPSNEQVKSRPLGENEYFCPECKFAHRLTSKLGKRHMKYKE